MRKHAEEAKAIEEAFEAVLDACENIKDFNQCGECPLRHLCIDDPETSVVDLGDLIGKATWEEFLEYAYEEATWSDEDLDAQHADFLRKYEEEERMIDGYDG